MVGRLVQKQDIGLSEQDLGQFYAHIPALGESVGQTHQLVVLEAQALERAPGLSLGWLALAQAQIIVQLVEAGYEGAVGVGFVIGAGLKFAGDGILLTPGVQKGVEGGHSLVQYGASAVVLHYLGKVSHFVVRGKVDAAGGGVLKPADELHYGGLPRPVLAGQAYLVSLAYVETYGIQQRPVAEGHRYVIQRQHLPDPPEPLRACIS